MSHKQKTDSGLQQHGPNSHHGFCSTCNVINNVSHSYGILSQLDKHDWHKCLEKGTVIQIEQVRIVFFSFITQWIINLPAFLFIYRYLAIPSILHAQ